MEENKKELWEANMLIAYRLKEIAEICEEYKIEHLSLSVDDGLYKFADVENNIYYSEETEARKERVKNLTEQLELKKQLEKDGIHV